MTKIIPEGAEALQACLESFAKDLPVAVPTETVYGLAAPINNLQAVKAIYDIKERPDNNPLIIHVSNEKQLLELATDIPEYAQELTNKYWPGPLTLVLKKKQDLPLVTAGLDTVAVRMPDNEFLLSLIAVTEPLCAPSANKSGRPSPTIAKHCEQDLQGEVDVIVDGGETIHGLESTVVDCTGEKPVVLRPGAITPQMIGAAIGEDEQGASPGTRHKHYSPDARVELVDEPVTGEYTISTSEDAWKTYEDAEELGKNLYRWLREADEQGAKTIRVQTIEEKGLGAAVMDRLKRASE